jgi:hypothetical protein
MNTESMGFGRSLELLNAGKSVSRMFWIQQGLFITMQIPDENSKMTKPYLYITRPLGDGKEERVPWSPNQTDLLATDWYEIIK